MPSNDRIEALLGEMTLEEKIAQLGSVWPGASHGTDDEDGAVENVAPMQDIFAQQVDFETATRHGIGHLTRPFGSKPVDPAEGAAALAELQRGLVEKTRLGIPAIVHEECLTGFTAYRASVFPAPLAWAATFDPALVEQMAHAIGSGMRQVGVHQGLSPVLDVVRDYRWGRVEETLGEDPYVVGMMASAYVRGLESAGIVATLKHFAGYSASRAARNHAPVSMGRRELHDVILPPFEMAVREGGARSVMNSYNDNDGVPAGADESLLTGILRDDWDFEGTVVSDYWSIAFLASMHRVATSNGEAGALALRAGIDVELPDALCYREDLLDQVRSGALEEKYVDRAVRRVLRQKAELGLLDDDWAPMPPGPVDLDPPGNRDIARRLAERAVVLLDNPQGVLPLAANASIAVVGPCADDPQAFFGCYSFPNHVLPRHPDLPLGEEGGPALAGVLSGRVVPSGKLPVQIPALPGGQPGTYLHPPLGGNTQGVSNLDPTPAYPFGHGLSYTTFAYADLALSADTVPADGEITISCEVTNTGGRGGEEVVQLYFDDPVAQVTRPVQQLAGFARVALEPGQRARVTFRLHTDRLAFTGLDLRRIVEPGRFDIAVGGSSLDTPLRGSFTVTGGIRTIDANRVLTTPVEVVHQAEAAES